MDTNREATGKAKTIKSTFNRETTVSKLIQAEPAIIWSLLTQADEYPRWNSTIISLKGHIAPGEKIQLVSRLAPKRTFKLKILAYEPIKSMVWGDGQGRRQFILAEHGNGITRFTMEEKIGGIFFPLYASYIPSFDESFEQFAADLKREAEAITRVQ